MYRCAAGEEARGGGLVCQGRPNFGRVALFDGTLVSVQFDADTNELVFRGTPTDADGGGGVAATGRRSGAGGGPAGESAAAAEAPAAAAAAAEPAAPDLGAAPSAGGEAPAATAASRTAPSGACGSTRA